MKRILAAALSTAGPSCAPVPSEPPPGPGPATDAAPAALVAERAPSSVVPGSAEREAAPAPAAPAASLPDGRPIVPCVDPPASMACVPGGPFVRGVDDEPKNARPAATVHLQTFYMDLYEVTNAEYRACRDAGQCPRGGPLYNDFSRPRQPITGISWYAAVRFCAARGKHLPTEAQWEKAARGPEGALHPWGEEAATCERAVIEDERGKSCGVKKLKEHPDKGRTFEIGSRPPGVYGLYDMSGNAYEWVFDWASDSWTACGEACAGVDPRGPCGGTEPCRGHRERVVRGGSWYWPAAHATGAHRRTHDPRNEISNFHHFGFRCAASVEEAEALRDAAAPGPARPG